MWQFEKACGLKNKEKIVLKSHSSKIKNVEGKPFLSFKDTNLEVCRLGLDLHVDVFKHVYPNPKLQFSTKEALSDAGRKSRLVHKELSICSPSMFFLQKN